MSSIIPSKEERKQRVLKLYFEDKKNYREIAHELRISLRDIVVIVNEAIGQESEQQPKKSKIAKAFQMFKDKKTPIDAVIELDITPAEAENIHKDYINLENRHAVNLYYDKLKGHMPDFIKYNRIIMENNEPEQQKIRIIIDNDYIISKQKSRIHELNLENQKVLEFKVKLDFDIERMRQKYEYLQNALSVSN